MRREDFGCGRVQAGPWKVSRSGSLPAPARTRDAFPHGTRVRAVLRDAFDAWKTCGLWNSLLQRSRLEPDLLQPDYHCQVQAGLECGLTPWLAEGRDLPLEAAEVPPDAAWLRWQPPEPALTICCAFCRGETR